MTKSAHHTHAPQKSYLARSLSALRLFLYRSIGSSRWAEQEHVQKQASMRIASLIPLSLLARTSVPEQWQWAAEIPTSS